MDHPQRDSDSASTTMPIRIGLADDQALVRQGIAMVLGSQPDLEVCWEANDGEEACALAAAEPVDIILMDVQMPGMDGIAATERIAGSGVATRIVILTTFDSDNYILGAISAGASGFLLKDSQPEELIEAVRTVHRSDAVISPRATAVLLRALSEQGAAGAAGVAGAVGAVGAAGVRAVGEERSAAGVGKGESGVELVDPLTAREEEILQLTARGLNNAEIAEALVISMPTVKTHVGRVLMKTGSRDRVQAVLWALRAGLVPLDGALEVR